MTATSTAAAVVVMRRGRNTVGPDAADAGGVSAQIVRLAGRREARVPVRLADVERPDKPVTRRVWSPGQ